MSRLFRLLSGLAPLLAGLFPSAAHAQGFILPRPIPVPRPLPISVKSQRVNLQITAGAMKVEVEQDFYNPNSAPAEGTYLFPLPEGAAVSAFRLTIDKEPVDGKLLTVDEARRIYETYVRRSIDPALLEYVGRNAFQAHVFPIPPGGERHIYLSYSQALEFSNGLYQAVYPLNSERVIGQPVGQLTISGTLRTQQPLKTIYSPSHEVQVQRPGDREARFSFEGKDVRANRDFVLYYGTSEKAFGLNALTHRKAGEDGYLMLMLAPKREAKAAEVQPKDVVFVLDTSGSMQGEKMEQARKALLTMVGALNDQDHFNVVRFSTDVTQFKEAVVPATNENRTAARTWIGDLKAIGGTAIDDALETALGSFPKGSRRSPYLVFMTDGLPTIGQTEPEHILADAAKAAPKGLRLFSFGIGNDVNTLLLDRLAKDNRGAADYVAPNEDLEAKIGSFYQKIADPVLSNVQVSVSGPAGVRFTDVYPQRVGDLFAGTQLLLLGRYAGDGKATVTLTGELNGAPQKYTYDLSLPEREPAQEFVPKLWGSRKIGFLLEQIRLHGETTELKDEVIRLSKEFGIVTPYTAYLVEEPNLPRPISPIPLPLFRDGVPLGGAGGAPGPATAPQREALKEQASGFRQDAGKAAVAASKRLRELKDRERGEPDVDVSRSVDGRAFRWTESGWKEEALDGKPTVVRVKFGSDAYFKLVSTSKTWARILSLGRQVTFRTGKNTVVSVGEQGAENLSGAEIQALER